MTRFFLDTNFVIDLLLRDEFKSICTKFLEFGKYRGDRFFISFLTVANFAYIARRLPKKEIYSYIQALVELFTVVPNTSQHIENAVKLQVDDFEDGLQYQTALDAHCDYIITRNEKDFLFSSIPVISASSYINNVNL